jgi:hypothetical protein
MQLGATIASLSTKAAATSHVAPPPLASAPGA